MSDEDKLRDLRAMWQQFVAKPTLAAEAEALASQIEQLKVKVAAAKPVATRLQGALARKERLAKEVLSAADAVASATQALTEAKAGHGKALAAQADLFVEISALQKELAASTGPSGPDGGQIGPLGPLAEVAAITSDLSANQLQTFVLHKEWVLAALRGLTGDLLAGLRAKEPDAKRPAAQELRDLVDEAGKVDAQPMELSGSAGSPVRPPAAKFSRLAAVPALDDPALSATHLDPPSDASASSLGVTPTQQHEALASGLLHPAPSQPSTAPTAVADQGFQALEGGGQLQLSEPSGSDAEHLRAALLAEASLAAQQQAQQALQAQGV
ncbi:MAG: hypothetical protein GY772_31650 [bacterium]|nr:hypothetical protein [bacterium]